MKKKLFEYKLILAAIMSFIFIAALISDINSIRRNPHDYNVVYQFSPSNTEWRLRSIENYIYYDVISIVVIGLYMVLNIQCYFKKGGKLLRCIILMIDIILLVIMVRGVYLFVHQGFDIN